MNYDIWIHTAGFHDGEPGVPVVAESSTWGGRPLSEEEVFTELKFIYFEYNIGSFDPWSIETPLDPTNPDHWLKVVCVPEEPVEGGFYCRFGFDSTIALKNESPFFLEGPPESIKTSIEELSESLTMMPAHVNTWSDSIKLEVEEIGLGSNDWNSV